MTSGSRTAGAAWLRDACGLVVALAMWPAAAAVADDRVLVQQAPEISSVAEVGEQLTASTGSWQPPRATPHYQWLRCAEGTAGCDPIPDATGREYTVTAADVGSAIAVQLTVTWHDGTSAPTVSQRTPVVPPPPPPPAPPLSVAPPTVEGTAQAGELLTGIEGSWSGTAPLTLADSWLRCDVHGAACDTLAAGANTLRLSEGDVGHTVRFQVTATNVAGESAAASVPTSAVRPAPSPVASGSPVMATPSSAGSSSPSAFGAPASLPGPQSASLMRPFPVVRIAGQYTSRWTTFSLVRISAPAGARIQVSCRGGGCRYRRTMRSRGPVRIRRLERRFRPGAVIEIRISASDAINKYVRIAVRGRRSPARRDRCLAPGAARPQACPAG